MLTFRNRLLILLIGLVAGAQTVTLFTTLASTRSHELRRAEAQLVDGAGNARVQLQEDERSLANAVAVLTADYALAQAVAYGENMAVSSALENHGRRIGATLTLAMDPDGHVIATGNGGPTDPELVAAIHAALGANADSARFVATSRGVHQVFVSPLRDEVGFVALGFPVDATLARRLRLKLGVEVAFLADTHASHTVVATTVDKLQGQDVPTDAVPEEATVITVGGEEYLSTVILLPSPGSQLDLALLKPMREVMAPIRKQALDLGLIIGFTLAAAVLAGVYLGRTAARPVQQLADGAARVAAGDYSQSVQGSGGRELAHLAEAFNSMQRGIADRESRLVHVARHDSATGLPNRYFAEQWIDERLRQLPAGQKLGVALVNVTNLRSVSASLGFDIAEQLVWHIARSIEHWHGGNGFVARTDAAHFLIALVPITGEEMHALLRDATTRARAPLDTAGVRLQAAVAIGATLAPQDGTTAKELLRCAEAAAQMAVAREQPHAFFEHASDESQRRRLKLGADLPNALESNQLFLCFQPKVRMRDRRPVGVEALVRWQHPDFGEVSPAEFVPIAEGTGASGLLTRWVLRQSLAQLAAWKRQDISMGVAVNLSAADILDPDLLRHILGSLRDARLAPGALTLEITESVLLHEPEAARRNIEMLRMAGVRFAIDDFGTGYSSLSQLRAIATDELKIDQSFVRALDEGPEHAAVIRAIAELGRGLGLKTVAEGVETEEQWRQLAELGCDLAQGYLTGRPQLPSELTPWLAAAIAQADPEPVARTASLRVLELRNRD
jgi:predicted signal transduction protein with EAL and GGDEF domain